MLEWKASEARKHLAEILDNAMSGDLQIIRRRGKRFALIPVDNPALLALSKNYPAPQEDGGK